jgi:hypothetical protein
MRSLVTAAIAALLLLLPVQFLRLPLNMSVPDAWAALALPLCWVFLVRARRPVPLPYLPAFWLIVLASGLATLFAADPGRGLAVILKEVYLYLWCVTLAAVFASALPGALRTILNAWLIAALGNGALILVQLVFPALLTAMNSAVAGFGAFDPHRPSGLLANSNAAALFQLMGFVPLVVLRPPPRRIVLVGALLLATIAGTGSMGAVVAAACGVAAGLAALAIVFRDGYAVLRFTAAATVCAALLGGLLWFAVSESPAIENRLTALLQSRQERSAQSRFAIWDRGVGLILADAPLTGVGPDMFKVLDGRELHNDFLAFAAERGVLGALGLLALGALALARALRLLQLGSSIGDRSLIVFPAALIAVLAHAQTHEVFHLREVWLLLALQEAALRRASLTVARR